MSRKYTIAESKERNKYIHIAPNLYIRSGKVVYKKCFVNPEGKSQQLFASSRQEWDLKKAQIEKTYAETVRNKDWHYLTD